MAPKTRNGRIDPEMEGKGKYTRALRTRVPTTAHVIISKEKQSAANQKKRSARVKVDGGGWMSADEAAECAAERMPTANVAAAAKRSPVTSGSAQHIHTQNKGAASAPPQQKSDASVPPPAPKHRQSWIAHLRSICPQGDANVSRAQAQRNHLPPSSRHWRQGQVRPRSTTQKHQQIIIYRPPGRSMKNRFLRKPLKGRR
jgi:hypothetical protein